MESITIRPGVDAPARSPSPHQPRTDPRLQGRLTMRRSLNLGAMIASALTALLSRPGFAQSQGEITGVSSNGTSSPPGPIIVNNLRIATLQNLNDEVMFNSYFLAPATLDFTVNVSGPGTYYVGY